jgi:hypothetical protein
MPSIWLLGSAMIPLLRACLIAGKLSSGGIVVTNRHHAIYIKDKGHLTKVHSYVIAVLLHSHRRKELPFDIAEGRSYSVSMHLDSSYSAESSPRAKATEHLHKESPFFVKKAVCVLKFIPHPMVSPVPNFGP